MYDNVMEYHRLKFPVSANGKVEENFNVSLGVFYEFNEIWFHCCIQILQLVSSSFSKFNAAKAKQQQKLSIIPNNNSIRIKLK